MRLNAYAAVSAWSAQANASAFVQKRQQSVNDLFSSLQNKDLAAAQKAFAQVSKNSPVLTPSSPMAQVGAALAKGQLEDATKIAQSIASFKSHFTASLPKDLANSPSAPMSPSQQAQSSGNNATPQRVSTNSLAQLFGQGSQVDLYA